MEANEQLAARISADVTKRIAEVIKKQLGETEQRLVAHADTLNADLKHQAELHRDALRQDAKAVADGYGATLDGIKRELTEINTNFNTKFGDHDLVLSDHNKRLVVLEKR